MGFAHGVKKEPYRAIPYHYMSIRNTINQKGKETLNVYCTAGYPDLDSTVTVLKSLSEQGVDLIELGMPYSDPLADGETIQKSSQVALQNGLTLDILFAQVKEARQSTQVPIIAMGYYNQMLQYGVEKFLSSAQESGIQGLIIPDLPMDIYERDYIELFRKHNIEISFLITPLTSAKRIRQADRLSSAFIYVVSQTSITGKKGDIQSHQKEYFERIEKMNLQSPRLIGFGIHDKVTYDTACSYSHGAIIGSAFIRALEADDVQSSIKKFIGAIR